MEVLATSNGRCRIVVGDCLEGLRTLPDESVNCCVTSPPYFGLRDYGTAKWEGGDVACDHKAPSRFDYPLNAALGPTGVQDQASNAGSGSVQQFKGTCGKCGATRIDAQLGLEPTPAEYVENMVDVFREVRRVLRDDGTLWLNLGDSYAGSGPSGASYQSETTKRRESGDGTDGVFRVSKTLSNRGLTYAEKKPIPPPGLKAKDLVGIPWRVAFALQADGWWLRQDIVWCLSGGTWVYARTQKGDMPMMVRDMARLEPHTVKLWNGKKWTQLLGMSKSKRRGDELEIVLRSGERISCTPTHRFPTQRGLLDAGDIRVGDTIESCRLPEPENPRDCALDEDAAWLAGLYIAEGSRAGDTIQIAGHAKESARWERLQRIAQKFGGSATLTVDENTQNIRLYGKLLNAIIDELVTGRIAKNKGFAPVVWRYSDSFVAAMVDGYLAGDGHDDAKNGRWRLGFCRNYNLERDLRTACARLGYAITLNMSSVKYDGKKRPTFRGELRKDRSGHHNERDKNEVVEIRKARCREVYDLGVADEPHLFALASGVLTHNSKPNPMPESVRDRCTKAHEYVFLLTKSAKYWYDAEAVKEESVDPEGSAKRYAAPFFVGNKHESGGYSPSGVQHTAGVKHFDGRRNRRSVWTIATKPYSGAHFAVMPPALVEPCILAGCPADGVVLDPFMGSGTVAAVALQHGRRAVGCELNPQYVELIKQRVHAELDRTALVDGRQRLAAK